MAEAGLVTPIVDGDEQLAGCSTSLISVTLYTTPGLHVDEGRVDGELRSLSAIQLSPGRRRPTSSRPPPARQRGYRGCTA